MDFIAFDLETTGFLPGVDKIVEVGAVKFVAGRPEAAFSTLINPERSMPRDASEVTGITDDMLVDQPKISEILQPLAEFCSDTPLVAHNAPFDYQFLTEDIRLHESKAPKGVVLDTCALAKKVLPGLINYKLGTLVQHLNIPSSQFHRAQEDASYCGYLFVHILSKMNVNGNLPALETLVELSYKEELNSPKSLLNPNS